MSKLGPHLIKSTQQGLAWARRAPIVGSVDNLEALKAAPDGAVRLFRHYFSVQDTLANPADIASAIIGSLEGYRHPRLYVQVFVGVSQTGWPSYRRLLERVVPLLHAAGLKVAGPSWYTGDYGAWQWHEARALGFDVFCCQAYWTSAGFTPWNALRWREYWREGDPLVIVGECGRDRVRDGPNGEYIGEPGWKRQDVSGEAYVGELRAYAAELERDPSILGAVVFSAGPNDDWRDFSTDELDVSPLYAGPVAPTAPDEENTEGGQMKLSEQYPREYAEWVAAGGIDNNFRAHLLGINSIAPTKADVPILVGQVKSATEQLAAVVAKLPLA